MNPVQFTTRYIFFIVLACLLFFTAACLDDDNGNGQGGNTLTTNSQGLAKVGAGSVNLLGGEDEAVTDVPLTVNEQGDTVTAEVISSAYTYGYASGKAGEDLYVFVQKVDPNKTQLEKADQTCTTCSENLGSGLPDSSEDDSLQKPTPKAITSSNGLAALIISNMKLANDLTVAVTPYKAPKYIPKLQDLRGQGYQIVSGADVNLSDPSGKPTTANKVCFCGSLVLKSAKFIGESVASELAEKIKLGLGSLELFVLKDKQWTAVEQAQATLSQQNGFWILSNTERTMRLYPFVYVFKPNLDTVFQGVVSGTVSDQNATPLSGAVLGFEQGAYTVSDANGTFSLDYVGYTSAAPLSKNVYARKTGYQQAAHIVSGLSPASPNAQLDISLASQPQGVNIQGIVSSDQEELPVSGAGLTLSSPLVLNQVDIQGQTITVGSDSGAEYTWQISDQGSVLSSENGTGQNVYTLPGTLVSGMADQEVYDLTVSVLHTGAGNATYTESIRGQFQKVDAAADIFLNPSAQASKIQISSNQDGSYAFLNIDQELLPFVRLQASATGYQPSDLLGPFSQDQVVNGVVTQDVVLVPTSSVSEYYEGFENEILDEAWTLTNSDPYVGWKLLEMPEQQAVAPNLLDEVIYPDRKTLDVPGEIHYIQESEPNATEGFAYAMFSKQGNATESSVDFNVLDSDQDGDFETIKNIYEYFESAQYEAWLQNPVEALNVGDPITVSYPDPADTQINLPPAYAGDWVLWYGNTSTGTYSDQPSNTSTQANSGSALTPLIDLSDYSFATGEIQTWFEVESKNIAQGGSDRMDLFVAVVDEQAAPGETIQVYDGAKTYSLTNGEFYHLMSFNPESAPPGPQQPFLNYSSGGVHSTPVWISRQVNLNPFVGHQIQLKFTFSTENTSFNGFRGWALDEAVILNQDNALDFQLSSISPGAIAKEVIQ